MNNRNSSPHTLTTGTPFLRFLFSETECSSSRVVGAHCCRHHPIHRLGLALGQGWEGLKKTNGISSPVSLPKGSPSWPLIRKGESLMELLLFTPVGQFWSLGYKICEEKNKSGHLPPCSSSSSFFVMFFCCFYFNFEVSSQFAC